MDTVSKPPELLALHDVTAELFTTLRSWFEVPSTVALDLDDIDSAVSQLADPVAIAALAMRKLQALRLLAQPGVRTSTDVVVTIVQDLDRALVQAPTMHLQRAAAAADWDAELADLLGDREVGEGTLPLPVIGSDDEDPAVSRFRDLHGRLHAAARAVVEASKGEIRYLV
ncbi:MAG: hypothetical protein WEB03_14065 [Nitriliruptor sp.]|uniref:hypothetical protein n=1 Tax=Nitriliruptor sp. TaxID=2448056 RepID=UPI0034A09E30